MDYQARQGKASSGTFAETASFGELDVLATLWAGVADAVKIADPKNLAGKGVIDVTNHLDLSGISYSHCLLEIQGKSCLTLYKYSRFHYQSYCILEVGNPVIPLFFPH